MRLYPKAARRIGGFACIFCAFCRIIIKYNNPNYVTNVYLSMKKKQQRGESPVEPSKGCKQTTQRGLVICGRDRKDGSEITINLLLPGDKRTRRDTNVSSEPPRNTHGQTGGGRRLLWSAAVVRAEQRFSHVSNFFTVPFRDTQNFLGGNVSKVAPTRKKKTAP